jgi:putative phosphoesterase
MLTRILVVSDSHGDRRTLRNILELHSEAACVFHLGDGAADMERLGEEYPHLTVYQVAGNCDSALRLIPEEQEVKVGGQRIFAVHGHRYDVKFSPLRFLYAARQRGVDLALFGHTHRPLLHREGALYLLNPGSVRHGGNYALIDITPGGILPHLEHIGNY